MDKVTFANGNPTILPRLSGTNKFNKSNSMILTVVEMEGKA